MDPSFKDFKLHDLSPFLIISSLSSAQRWRNSPPFERFFAGRDGCLQFVRAASSFVDRCCCSRPVFLKDYPRRRRLTRALPLPRIFQPEKVTDLDRACGAGHTESILPSNSHGVVTVSSSNLLETPWPRYATPVEEGGLSRANEIVNRGWDMEPRTESFEKRSRCLECVARSTLFITDFFTQVS